MSWASPVGANCRKNSRLATTKSPKAMSCRATTARGSSAGRSAFFARCPDPLNGEGRRHLGVPVVEEMADHQGSGVVGDLQPVSFVGLGREDQVHLAVRAQVQLVEEDVRRRRHAGHGLQADIAGRATVSPEAVGLAAPEARARIDAVGAVHAPLVDRVDARGLDREHGARLFPERIVQPDAEEHEQMTEAGGHVRRVVAAGVGQHHGGGLAQAVEQVGPRTSRQEVVGGGVPGASCLAHRVRHPGRVDEGGRHGTAPTDACESVTKFLMCGPPARVGRAMLPRHRGIVKPPRSPFSKGAARSVCPGGGGSVPRQVATGRADDT